MLLLAFLWMIYSFMALICMLSLINEKSDICDIGGVQETQILNIMRYLEWLVSLAKKERASLPSLFLACRIVCPSYT